MLPIRLTRTIACAALLMTAACRPAQTRLANTHESREALAAAVLHALEQRDEQALRALAVDESEFRDHVWPELPVARPERNLPLTYVWQDLRQKSDAGLARTLADHGGRAYRLQRLRFRGGTTPYRTFMVHRDSMATVVDAAGHTRDIPFFGSVVEKDGRLKVFSYVVD